MINNRMPEVGAKYKSKIGSYFDDFTVEILGRFTDCKGRKMIGYLDEMKIQLEKMDVETFLDQFEELPNQEQKCDHIPPNANGMCPKCGVDTSKFISDFSSKDCSEDISKMETTEKPCPSCGSNEPHVACAYIGLKTPFEKAKEELRQEIEKEVLSLSTNWLNFYMRLKDKAQNLLNALDDVGKTDKSLDDFNIPEKGGCGIVGDTREEVKSVEWIETPYKPGTTEFYDWYRDKFGVCPMSGAKLNVKIHYQDKPKSLWKDVSEKPKLRDFEQVFIKWTSGRVKLAEHHDGEFYNIGKVGTDATYDHAIEFCLPADLFNSFEQLQNKVEILENRLMLCNQTVAYLGKIVNRLEGKEKC